MISIFFKILFLLNLHEVIQILIAVYILYDETLFWQQWSKHLTARFSQIFGKLKASFSKLSPYLKRRNKKYFQWKLIQGLGALHFSFYLLSSHNFSTSQEAPSSARDQWHLGTSSSHYLWQNRLFLLSLRNILFTVKVNKSQQFHLQCKVFLLREPLNNIFFLSLEKQKSNYVSEIYFIIFSWITEFEGTPPWGAFVYFYMEHYSPEMNCFPRLYPSFFKS